MPGKGLTGYLLFKGSEKVNLIFKLDEQLNKNILMQKLHKYIFICLTVIFVMYLIVLSSLDC